jgi:hypothetical protein
MIYTARRLMFFAKELKNFWIFYKSNNAKQKQQIPLLQIELKKYKQENPKVDKILNGYLNKNINKFSKR